MLAAPVRAMLAASDEKMARRMRAQIDLTGSTSNGSAGGAGAAEEDEADKDDREFLELLNRRHNKAEVRCFFCVHCFVRLGCLSGASRSFGPRLASSYVVYLLLCGPRSPHVIVSVSAVRATAAHRPCGKKCSMCGAPTIEPRFCSHPTGCGLWSLWRDASCAFSVQGNMRNGSLGILTQ